MQPAKRIVEYTRAATVLISGDDVAAAHDDQPIGVISQKAALFDCTQKQQLCLTRKLQLAGLVVAMAMVRKRMARSASTEVRQSRLPSAMQNAAA